MDISDPACPVSLFVREGAFRRLAPSLDGFLAALSTTPTRGGEDIIRG